MGGAVRTARWLASSIVVVLAVFIAFRDPRREPTSTTMLLEAIVTSEQGVPGLFPDRASGSNVTPALASDGTIITVVWQHWSEDYANKEIAFARVRASDGVLLDPVYRDLAVGKGFRADPQVACDGLTCVVVWSVLEPNDTRFVYGARIRAVDGFVLDPGGVLLRTGASFPSIAFDGQRYLVTFSEAGQIRGMRLASGSMAPLDAQGIDIAGDKNSTRLRSVVAGSKGQFLVAWSDPRTAVPSQRSVYSARIVGSTGALLDPAGGVLVTSATKESDGSFGAPRSIGIATNQTDYLIAWVDTTGDVKATRMRGSDGQPIGPPTSLGVGEAPTIDFDGASYLVAYGSPSGDTPLTCTRIAPSDGSIVSSIKSSSYGRDGFALAPNGNTHFLVVGAVTTVYGTRLGLDGVPLAQFSPISRAGNRQLYAQVARSGSEWVAVWSDLREDAVGTYYGRIDSNGAPRDGSGRFLAYGGLASIACNATECFVAWTDGSIKATRVRTSDAAVLDSPPLVLATLPPLAGGWISAPRVACNGMDFLVTWTRHDEIVISKPTGPYLTKEINDVFGARVTAAGGQSAPFAISFGTGLSEDQEVVSDGTDFLALWRENGALAAVRLSATQPSPRIDLAPILIATFPPAIGSKTAACRSGECLIAYSPEATAKTYARRLSLTTGTLLDPAPGIPIATTGPPRGAAYDGLRYGVLAGSNVVGLVRVRADDGGIVSETSPLGTEVVSILPTQEGRKLAAGATDTWLAGYDRLDPALRATRFRWRIVTCDGEGACALPPAPAVVDAGEEASTAVDAAMPEIADASPEATTSNPANIPPPPSASNEPNVPSAPSEAVLPEETLEVGGSGCHLVTRESNGSRGGWLLALLLFMIAWRSRSASSRDRAAFERGRAHAPRRTRCHRASRARLRGPLARSRRTTSAPCSRERRQHPPRDVANAAPLPSRARPR